MTILIDAPRRVGGLDASRGEGTVGGCHLGPVPVAGRAAAWVPRPVGNVIPD